MKKIIGSLLVVFLTLTALASAFVLNISAENNTDGTEAAKQSSKAEVISSDQLDNVPVSHAYLMTFMEEFKKELLSELAQNGISSGNGSGYCDVTLSQGQRIVLGADCEIIFRGGSAIAITSSHLEGEGLTDISVGNEIFSGEALALGHIYYPSGSSAKKAILVTGGTAHFTLKGNYDIV